MNYYMNVNKQEQEERVKQETLDLAKQLEKGEK